MSTVPGPVAVTGATGFLGSHIVEALLAAGKATRGVVRTPRKAVWLSVKGMSVAQADIADVPALTDAFHGASAVVANAALGSKLGDLQEMERTNVLGTENTLRAAAAAGVRRVVYISSVAVYLTRVRTPMREDTERYGHTKRLFAWSDLTTDWRYALTKCIAEDRAASLAKELGLALTVLRPSPVYGSRDTRWTARILRLHHRAFVVAPTLGIPMVHAGDVAAAVVATLDRPATIGNAYTLAGPPVTIPKILSTFREVSGSGPVVLKIPVPLWVEYDTTAAQRDLGFSVRSLEEGAREVVGGMA